MGPYPKAWPLMGWALVFLALLTLLRVVMVDGPEGRQWLLLWPWDRVRVEFIHSVTGRPVLLEFQPLWRFQGFQAHTDPETEAYYTGGEAPWNQALDRVREKALSYCSEVGLALGLGGRWFKAQGGCLRLRLLWPP